MKARVKATGALLEVRLQDIDTEYPYICDMQGEGGTLWKESELEFLEDESDYWTRLEHQAAIAAMGSMCGNTKYNDYAWVDMAKFAIKAAHALVEKLKESK